MMTSNKRMQEVSRGPGNEANSTEKPPQSGRHHTQPVLSEFSRVFSPHLQTVEEDLLGETATKLSPVLPTDNEKSFVSSEI